MQPTGRKQSQHNFWLLQVLKKLAVMKDINGNSVLVRVIRRRRKAAYQPIVPIERLFDTISLHHRDSVGFRGEKKLWNFVSFRQGQAVCRQGRL